MSEGVWELDEDVLILKTGMEKKLIPTAREIYSAEFEDKKEIQGHSVTRPSDSLSQISFTKYPLRLEIWLKPYKKQNQNEIYSCNIIGRNNTDEYLINSLLTSDADHIIRDKTWFPLIDSEKDEVLKIFNDGGIHNPGILTLRQFFYLVRIPVQTVKIVINPQTKIVFPEPEYKKQEVPDRIEGFAGKLYKYQLSGIRWLKMVDRENLGCVLADEMGLGKTIQIICLILSDVGQYAEPVLIIAPATLLENWKREINRFAPGLRVMIHQGAGRTGFHSDFRKYDVVVTSYDTLIRDVMIFRMFRWNIIVLDEAQAIKNPYAKRTQKVKSLNRRMGIAVTGTPVENALLDLWSIFDFVIPGFLGSKEEFEKQFCSIDSAEKIEPIITPLMLRRKVAEVADDLPEKIIIPQALTLALDLVGEYEKIRTKTLSEYGPSGGLVSLLRLRMFCSHPYLITSGTENPEIVSPKYRRFTEILEEIIENNERVLVFTEFTEMINIFFTDLPQRFPGIFVDIIDGRVKIPERQLIVDRFNSHKGASVLLLNPKAAGTGLNLTGANHVIHYTPVWNPAVEDQASARAYRWGQSLPVTIHRLFYVDTVEDIMNERLAGKREMSDQAVVGTSGEKEEYEDIRKALEITPFR